jgi:hypothetical protein
MPVAGVVRVRGCSRGRTMRHHGSQVLLDYGTEWCYTLFILRKENQMNMTNEDIEDRIKLIDLLREAEAEVEA